jgi:hypothetical protein
VATLAAPIVRLPLFGSRRALFLIERNLARDRRLWVVFLSGFFEPVLARGCAARSASGPTS